MASMMIFIAQNLLLQLLDNGQRPLGQLGVFVALALDPVVQRRHDAEIDVHGLELGHGLVADIQPQSADGGLPGEVHGGLAQQPPGGLHPHQKTRGAGLHIPLHAGHLSGKGDAGPGLQPVIPVQQPGGIQIGVPVHNAIAQESGIMESGDHGEHPLLLREAQVGLEPHQV